ncbi:MAG TPA: chemotaxis protein CheX [Polyangiaceae bacterium]
MSHSLQPADWLDATLAAATEFSETTLGSGLGDTEAIRKLPENLTGCFVALVGQEESLQIGVASDPRGCQVLAQALFASDDPLPDTDVADALGEIANIMAGGVKKRSGESNRGMALGLPIVMEGHVRISEHQQMVHCDIAMGDAPVRLLVVCTRDAAD